MQLHMDVYLWCAFQVFVFLKLASNVVLQGRARKIAKVVIYPEDVKSSVTLIPDPSDVEVLKRATNVFRNDLENILPFSMLALAVAFTQLDARVYLAIIVVFAFTRLTHAVCLINAMQPFRTVSYLLGQICALVFVVALVIRLIPIFQAY